MVNSSMDEIMTKLNQQTKNKETDIMKSILKSAVNSLPEVMEAQQNDDLEALSNKKWDKGIGGCLLPASEWLDDPSTGESAPTVSIPKVLEFIDRLFLIDYRPPKAKGGGSASKTDAQLLWHKEVLEVFAKHEAILEKEGKAPKCFLRDLGLDTNVVTPSEDNSKEVTK